MTKCWLDAQFWKSETKTFPTTTRFEFNWTIIWFSNLFLMPQRVASSIFYGILLLSVRLNISVKDMSGWPREFPQHLLLCWIYNSWSEFILKFLEHILLDNLSKSSVYIYIYIYIAIYLSVYLSIYFWCWENFMLSILKLGQNSNLDFIYFAKQEKQNTCSHTAKSKIGKGGNTQGKQ